jgi:hypothetical protein
MGSTPFGNAGEIDAIGRALPYHIEIDRDGWRRVRIGGRS